jgi:tetratricopeptide (TPR) repeat protein
MALDPELPWSLFVQALVHNREGDMQGFVDLGKRVLDAERDSHTLGVMGLYLSYTGRTEAARQYAEEAASLDPLSWLTTHGVPFADLLDGKADLAFEKMRDLARRLAPGESWPAYEVTYAALQAGRNEEARTWAKKAIAGRAPFYVNWGYLFLHLLDGDHDAAERVLRNTALRAIAKRAGVVGYRLGSCYAEMGREDEALEWLDRAVGQGFTHHGFMAKHDRLIAPLRGDPRFEALVEKARGVEEALEL